MKVTSTIRFVSVLVALLAAAPAAFAQRGRGAGPGAPAQSPQAGAPIDLTGYWVAIVNEDWRWRMVTPPKGDYASIQNLMTAEARKLADSWDPSQDGSCLAYGAAGLMRMPTRLNVTWENENTLKIETDAGQQTRRLMFDAAAAPAQRSLQGHSVAAWEPAPTPARGGGPPTYPKFGNLRVTTTNLTAGWLRKNGAPYSENATMTEYFDRFKAPNNDEWL